MNKGGGGSLRVFLKLVRVWAFGLNPFHETKRPSCHAHFPYLTMYFVWAKQMSPNHQPAILFQCTPYFCNALGQQHQPNTPQSSLCFSARHTSCQRTPCSCFRCNFKQVITLDPILNQQAIFSFYFFAPHCFALQIGFLT